MTSRSPSRPRSRGAIRRVIALATALFGASASADYVMTASSGGESSLTLSPGQSFTLDIVLSTNSGDLHNSAIFRVEFSDAGLLYAGYDWSSPYVTGGLFDDSKPFVAGLPVLLDESTLAGVGYPADVVDIELSNVALSAFGAGTLVSLNLVIPANWTGPSMISIALEPDTIALGFDPVSTLAGDPFVLHVVPSPPAMLLLAIGALAQFRRRSPPRPRRARTSGASSNGGSCDR